MTEKERAARPRAALRVVLAAFMVAAGVGHFLVHDEFLKQLPRWLPGRSLVVWSTGVIEVALGLALVMAPPHRRRVVGGALAVFLVAVFPGNLYQAVAGTTAFNITTSAGRWGRLLLQPPLIALALWSTGAWPHRRGRAGAATSCRHGGPA